MVAFESQACAGPLNSEGNDRSPEQIRSDGTPERQVLAAQRLALAGELLHVSGLLGASGITAVALKGPVLSLQPYGSSCVRDAVDLDVLVSRRDAARALELLTRNGYRSQDGTRIDRAFAFGRYEIALVSQNSGIVVDLHWELLRAATCVRFDAAEALGRSEEIKFDGGMVRSLCGDDLFLYLCLHAAQHCWSDIKWIKDIGRLMEVRPRLDWEALLGRACDLRCCRRVLVTAVLVRTLCCQALPGCFEQAIASDPKAAAIAREASEMLATEEWNRLQLLGIDLSARDCWIDRIRYWLNFLAARTRPTMADRKAVPLPRCCSVLHYFIRPVRLCRAYGVRYTLRFLSIGFSAKSREGPTAVR